MVWVGNLNVMRLCRLSSDVNSVLNNIDLSKVVGIVGDGCDFTHANGTKCQLSCVSGYCEQVMLNVLMEPIIK